MLRHLPPVVVAIIIANVVGTLLLGMFGLSYYERQKLERENEQPYLEYLNLPFPTLESAVQGGHPIRLVVQRRNHDTQSHIYSVVAKLICDSDPNEPPVILVSNMAPVDPGDTEWISAINIIPINQRPGTYHIEGFADVPGVYRSFTLPWASQQFKVVGLSY